MLKYHEENPSGDSRVKRLSKKKSDAPAGVQGILGLGLDTTDGQTRVTRSDEMVLVGGSASTHEKMQETAIRFSEGLAKRGKALPEASVAEVMDLLRQAHDKTGS